IPYWLNHCRVLVAATEGVPTFGRTPGSPERLAGVAHRASARPDALPAPLPDEGRGASGALPQFSTAQGRQPRPQPGRGEMSVADVLERFIVSHAEEHLAQVEAALRTSPKG